MLFICDVNDMNEFSSFPCLVPAINPANFVYDFFSGDSTHDVMCRGKNHVQYLLD